MRFFFTLAIIPFSLLLLSGCGEKLGEARNSILDTANKTAEGLGYQYEVTKQSIQQKQQELEEAAAKVREATESVKEAKEALDRLSQ